MSDGVRQNYSGVFDRPLGFGQKPAILVVDFIAAYTEPSSPLYAPPTLAAIRRTAPLCDLARRRRVPVIFTRVLYSTSGLDGGLWLEKVPALRGLTEGAPLASFTPDLSPQPGDVVITKQYASAFFGTSLASLLNARGIDTLLLTGVSTSGCVRATAVDGLQYGFRVMVPAECVADRHEAPHRANLLDIDAKYGDVVTAAQAEAYLGLV